MSERMEAPPEPTSGGESIARRAWPRDRQIKFAVLGSAAVIGSLLVFLLAGRLFAKPEPASASPLPPGTFRATAQQLKSMTLKPVELRGFASEEATDGKIAVNADRTTPLFSPYSGRVTRVIAKVGATVKSGEPLAIVDASEFLQAQSDLATATAQAKIARISEERKHALFESKGGSQQDWQQAQTDLAAAESTLGLARNRLKIFDKSDAEIAALESGHAMSPTAVLTAPIAGVVVDRQIGLGQYLQAGGGTAVFTIADPSSVWVQANVRESDAGRVRVGEAVEVRVLAYANRVFKARVSYVGAFVDPTTHRLPVRAEIDNRDGALKPEMFANFRILTGDASTSPAVPESAVVYEGELAHVWVLSAPNVLAYRPIRTGRTSEGFVEVLDGLKAGDTVVTRGSLFIDQAASPSSS